MTTILLRRNSSVQWATLNPILLSGEQGYETDTGKMKIGNGHRRWLELEYYLPQSDVQSLIDNATFSGGSGASILTDHIDSPNPHPVYDDGPSLFLLYENAKV
jgi:hypothetical protein